MPFFENSGAGSSVDALLLIGLCLMSGFDSSRKRHHGRQTTRQVLVVIEFVRSLAVHFRWSGTQGRRMPEGPALALLRIAARHPRVLRENLAASA